MFWPMGVLERPLWQIFLRFLEVLIFGKGGDWSGRKIRKK